jgi:type II secretory pathway component PulF
MKLNAPKLENKLVFFRLLAVTQKAGLGIRESLQSIYKSETHP